MEEVPSLLGAVVGAGLLIFATEKLLTTESMHSKSASLLDTVY